jgi:hypothetical protein
MFLTLIRSTGYGSVSEVDKTMLTTEKELWRKAAKTSRLLKPRNEVNREN